MLNDEATMIEVVKELQGAETPWIRWLNRDGAEGKVQAANQVKDHEKETARLKRLLAEMGAGD